MKSLRPVTFGCQNDTPDRVKEAGHMAVLRNLSWVLLVAILLVTEADAQSERPLHFLSKQCNEDAIEVLLDPQPRGILRVVGRPNLVPWIKARRYPVSVTTFFPMWSRANLGNAALH